MKIQRIVSQYRRDFHAIYECEHCGATETGSGYDDALFHYQVIPSMKCESCGQTAMDDYEPRATKYPEGRQV